jgi:hypothetical protein
VYCSYWNVVLVECCAELIPRHSVTILNSGSMHGPPRTCGPTKMLWCKTKSSETQSREVVQTLTQPHKASDYLRVGLSSKQSLGFGLPRTRGRRTLEATDVIANILPDIHQFLPTSTSWHYEKLSIARISLEASVERVEA